MAQSILITECLQNDFVKPIGRYDPLPNLLHVGYDEARRLVGDIPAEGPVSRMMAWAHTQPSGELCILHIRDWHDPSDPWQAAHLKKFGSHCIQNTPGAEFVFTMPPSSEGQDRIIDSLSLNDFQKTPLEKLLLPFAGKQARVGLMGVWTEAKITFLAYELASRYPTFEIGVCSALTASSSRAQHFLSLEQLRKILNVTVFASVSEFITFLGGSAEEIPLAVPEGDLPGIAFTSQITLNDTDLKLLRYLFRSSSRVDARVLDGGFSGNVVLGTESRDLFGHQEVSHVIKIGDAENIGQERASFEQIESVLGNAAPRIVDFADFGKRGALKYRYASMGGGFSTTFQKLYMAGMEPSEVERILTIVFSEQLGRLYAAAKLETTNLLEHYFFSSRWAPNVRRRVEELLGEAASGDAVTISDGETASNVCRFYEQDIDTLIPLARDSHYSSFVHGDLNGANIILDGRKNVWIIDYFHTARGHVLKDLVKLENDVLFIYTLLLSHDDLHEACRLTDHLLTVTDLGVAPQPLPSSIKNAPIRRAFETVQILRSFYPALVHSDRDPLQFFIAQMRYAVHTLSFDESSGLQKRWALYTACRAAELIKTKLTCSHKLRVDWIFTPVVKRGKVGITLLPGRKDMGRNLSDDCDTLRAEGITHIVCLVPHGELEKYGVGNLLKEYAVKGFSVYDLPIADQHVCSEHDLNAALDWVTEALARDANVAIHCVGGLGRSGTVAACLLKKLGLSTDDAVSTVREARSERAIETQTQLEFVTSYAAGN